MLQVLGAHMGFVPRKEISLGGPADHHICSQYMTVLSYSILESLVADANRQQISKVEQRRKMLEEREI